MQNVFLSRATRSRTVLQKKFLFASSRLFFACRCLTKEFDAATLFSDSAFAIPAPHSPRRQAVPVDQSRLFRAMRSFRRATTTSKSSAVGTLATTRFRCRPAQYARSDTVLCNAEQHCIAPSHILTTEEQTHGGKRVHVHFIDSILPDVLPTMHTLFNSATACMLAGQCIRLKFEGRHVPDRDDLILTGELLSVEGDVNFVTNVPWRGDGTRIKLELPKLIARSKSFVPKFYLQSVDGCSILCSRHWAYNIDVFPNRRHAPLRKRWTCIRRAAVRTRSSGSAGKILRSTSCKSSLATHPRSFILQRPRSSSAYARHFDVESTKFAC